jgi:predicted AlkP superfamily phosphohydrolase/phosphomutase
VDTEQRRRVMVIGLDALDQGSLARWVAQGHLPNIAAFMQQSLPFEVRSDGATLHGSIWPTFASGTGPGHHGIYWWTQWIAEEGRYQRNSHPALQYAPFWEAAVREGKRVIVVDVPYTPALPGRHAWTANGWGLHDEMTPVSAPGPFLRAIRSRYGDHPLRADVLQPMDGPGKLAMAAQLGRGVTMRSRLISDFAARRDWELFIAVFSETHKAGHYLAEAEDFGAGCTNDTLLREILQPLDDRLPEIVRNAGEDCDLFLLSLHGMQAQRDYGDAIGRQLIAAIAGREPGSALPRPDAIRRIGNVMPAGLRDSLWLALPPGLRARRYEQSIARSPLPGEPLFSPAHDGGIAFRANIAGRERDGWITASQASALLADLAALAAGMRADGGEPAFEALQRPAEVYPGPRAHRLPDGLLRLNPEVRSTSTVTTAAGAVLRNTIAPARNGVHTGDGFCFVRPGPAATPLQTAVDNRDFAPTILRRLGVPAPTLLQGEAFIG